MIKSQTVKELVEQYVKEELNPRGYRLAYFDDMTDPCETVICVCLGNYHVQIPVTENLFAYSFQYIRNKIELAISYLDELLEANEKNETTVWLRKPVPKESEVYGGKSCTTN